MSYPLCMVGSESLGAEPSAQNAPNRPLRSEASAVFPQGGLDGIGLGGVSRSKMRALDEGGMVWDGGDPSKTLDETFEELDMALAKWMREAFLE